MILDSVTNLNNTYLKLCKFIESNEEKLKLEAITVGSPEPYKEFLPYIEILKTKGMVSVQFSRNRGLEISGSKQHLQEYVGAFKFEENEDGNHHHPELSLINKEGFEQSGLWPFVEADNDYVEEHENQS